ncbi:MAG: EcsC family protein [Bacillota bacterium]|nr:EcsC family protein [Bacillota bacterium]
MKYDSELLTIELKERKLLKAAARKRTSIIDRKIQQYVPDNLKKTLNDMFELAFRKIFQNGVELISITFDKNSPEEAEEMLRKSKLAATFDTGMSFVTGTGLGLLGIGVPDIPVFTAMVLRNIYQIASAYGFDYRSRTEQVYILKVIKGALASGEEAETTAAETDRYADDVDLRGCVYDSWLGDELDEAAHALADSMIYMKFVQGMPVVGAAGGISNALTMRKISRYADIKYHKRMVRKKLNNLEAEDSQEDNEKETLKEGKEKE